jgi:hypothetical protein
MRKEAPADSGRLLSVRGYSGYRRSNHARTRQSRLAGWLSIAAVALTLTAGLAACASAAAPGSAATSADARSAAGGSASRSAAAAGSGSGSAPTGGASTASQAGVLAAARRVRCPAGWDSVTSVPGRNLRAERIPAGFRPVAVVECTRVPTIVPVAGIRIVELRRVAVTGLGPLVAALRLPSLPRSRALVPACLLPVATLPWIVLIGPGDHLLHPQVPIGDCGLPITPVQTSLSSLHWKTLSATRGVSIGPRLRVAPRPE